MQNFIQNLNTVSKKACILSQNLKTLTGTNYPGLQYFLLKLRTHLQNVYKTSPTYQCFAKECAGLFFIIIIFFNWDSLHARLNSHYKAWNYKKKKHKKDYSIQEICLEPTFKKCLLILDLKPLRS